MILGGLLKKYAHLNYHLLSVFHKELVEFICAEYGLQEVLECYQAAYLFETPPVYDNHLQIRCAVEDGLQTIMTT